MARKPISEHEYVKLKTKGFLDKEIAHRLGVTVPALSRAKKRWELTNKVVTVTKANQIIQENSNNPQRIDDLEAIVSKIESLALKVEVSEYMIKNYIFSYAETQLEKLKDKGISTEAGIAMLLKSVR